MRCVLVALALASLFMKLGGVWQAWSGYKRAKQQALLESSWNDVNEIRQLIFVIVKNVAVQTRIGVILLLASLAVDTFVSVASMYL